MIEESKATVQLWDLSDDSLDFKYHAFEHQCEKIYASMVALKQISRKTKGVTTSAPSTSSTRSQNTPRLSDKEFVWKIHSYLDSVGKCHYCKGYCGSAYWGCTGPYVKEKVTFPPGYTAPPRPTNYVPPRARSSPPSANAGRTTQAPAGRPANPSWVAAIQEYPDLEPATVAALQDLDDELAQETPDKYVQPEHPRVIVDLLCNGKVIQALADPGSELNLVSD